MNEQEENLYAKAMKQTWRRCCLAVILPLLVLPAIHAVEPQDPALGKYPLAPSYYKELVELGFLPSKPHISTLDLAEKLNLDLPQLAAVKAALVKKDPKALDQSLGAYLNSRLPPIRVVVTGKPPANARLADQWLQPQIVLGGKEYPIAGTPSRDTFSLGDDVDWYRGSANAFVELSQWGVIRMVGNAYANSGDPKYAEAMIRYVRSFYRTAARPPAQRPKTVFGAYGPWRSLNASGRIMGGYMPATYREIGAASCVTDADRVMFLTMFWEHGNYCHQLLTEHVAHNFELQIVRGLMDLALQFPEFRNSQQWLDRCALREGQNMHDCVLEDGGLYERTGYHFGSWHSYVMEYQRMRDAGAKLPPSFTRRLEKMSEATALLMSPTLQHPQFGLGDMADQRSKMQAAAALFPQRADFAYVASGGREGSPPKKLAHVMPFTGWLTMRSDWSANALYMALNFNGNPRSQAGHYDQASFGLWAFGRPWMTNPGTCEDYSLPEYRAYVGTTIGANTVMVDDAGQDRWDNSGRLESWADLPGFTYCSAANGSYRGLGGTHRRSILFLRSEPGYWLMMDRISGDGKPHDYRWLGHFQPTQLSIDPHSKAISTALHDGKRLWLIPARPETLSIEQSSGPLVTPQNTGALPPYHPTRAIGPYVALRQKAVTGPASYAVLLYPAADGGEPRLESLPSDPKDDAAGFRVRRGAQEDLLVLAASSGARSFGSREDGYLTDAEMAYVRRVEGKLVEASLVAGSYLKRGSETLIDVGPQIVAVQIRHHGDMLELNVRGHGVVRISKGAGRRVVANGKPVPAHAVGEHLVVQMGRDAKLEFTAPEFATDPVARCKGIGVPLGYGGTYQGPPQSALVSFKTSVPSDMILQWRVEGESTWKRVVNPEPVTDHYYLLTDLEHQKTYNVSLTCRGEEGHVHTIATNYVYREPAK